MLSGIWPRGSSSAPGSGNTGMISGSSPGPRYSALIGMGGPEVEDGGCSLHGFPIANPHGPFAQRASGKQNRRKPLAPVDGGSIGRPPGFEKLYQLLAGAVLVPFAVALDDREQLLGRLRAFAVGVERGREIETGLMVERIGRDFLPRFGDRADRLGLLGEIERGLYRLDGRVVAL